MMYFKMVSDDIVMSVNTVNESIGGNITEAEYSELTNMFVHLPGGMAVHDNGDGTYSYIENPDPPDPDPDVEDAEVLEILFGGVE